MIILVILSTILLEARLESIISLLIVISIIHTQPIHIIHIHTQPIHVHMYIPCVCYLYEHTMCGTGVCEQKTSLLLLVVVVVVYNSIIIIIII